MDFTEIKTRLEIYETSRRRMGEGPDITQEALDAILALEAENERLNKELNHLTCESGKLAAEQQIKHGKIENSLRERAEKAERDCVQWEEDYDTAHRMREAAERELKEANYGIVVLLRFIDWKQGYKESDAVWGPRMIRIIKAARAAGEEG